MEEIRMVDLKSQYNNIKDEIDTAIKSVIDSTAFIRGKEHGLFEEELAKFLDTKNVIACGNGTDALQVALMALDLEKCS
jgi:UDP-2-acetamido-2-deoxy-ribo-hexuluronate aminotransferase